MSIIAIVNLPLLSQAAEPDLSLFELEAARHSEEYRKLAREKRHESISFAKGYHGNPVGRVKAELMLRLGELYLEEAEDLHLTELRTFLHELETCGVTAGCDPSLLEADHTAGRANKRLFSPAGLV